MSADRRPARILAMQTLCQWDVQPENAPPIPDDLSEDAAILPQTRTKAAKIVKAYFAHQEQVDQRISDASHKWDLTRLSPVERNIMRVAVAEWLSTDVPPKVSLNEAIEIGREYGGKDSPGFINGVLDQVLKTLNDKGPTA